MIETYKELYIKLLTREGFTVRRSNLERADFTSGYQVGGIKPHFKSDLASGTLNEFVSQMQKMKKSTANFIGGWVNTYRDKDYYDVEGSEWIADFDDAWELAEKRNQVAFWDWSNSKNVILYSKETTTEAYSNV